MKPMQGTIIFDKKKASGRKITWKNTYDFHYYARIWLETETNKKR